MNEPKKPKKPKKRYETAQAIEDEIDAVIVMQRAKAKEAEGYDNKAEALILKLENSTSDYSRQQIGYQIEAMRTVPMSFIEEPSVILQK